MLSSTCRFAVVALLLGAGVPSRAGAQTDVREASRLAKQGVSDLDKRQFPAALRAFASADAITPGDANLSVGAGVAAFMMGQHDAAQEWFERALQRKPDSLTASEWLGELHYRADRVDTAIALYEAAVERSPGLPAAAALSRRLDTWRREAAIQVDFAEIRGRVAAIRFHESRDEALASVVLERVEAEYARIAEALGTEPSQPASVVLYTREEFEAITALPRWTAAAYDGRIRLPISGAQIADAEEAAELDRVLAHELVHAVVATLAGSNAPVWLNEGLATVLEPEGSLDAETPLAREGARPSLEHLHTSFVQLNTADAEIAYALSARAVRRMTELAGTPAIVALLQDLGRGATFERAFRDRFSTRYAAFRAGLARD